MTDTEPRDGRNGGGPAYGEYPCPDCPRVFKLAGYRDRHVRREHRVNVGGRKAKGGKVVCPECLTPYAPRYLGAHMRKAHGIYGGVSGHPRSNGSNLPAVIEPRPVVHSNGNGAVPTFRADPNLIVLVDDSNEIWICERLAGRAH